MPLIVVCPLLDAACPETVMFSGVAETNPLLSSAITISVCGPDERNICVSMELSKVK